MSNQMYMDVKNRNTRNSDIFNNQSAPVVKQVRNNYNA